MLRSVAVFVCSYQLIIVFSMEFVNIFQYEIRTLHIPMDCESLFG
jgi:hypothetical protein